MQRLLAPARTLLQHRGFLVVLGCGLLLGLAFSFVSPFFSLFATVEAKMTPLSFGVFMTITSLSAIVVSTLLARWSDTHWSRRSMLALGSGCGVIGYLGYAYARDIVWLTLIGSTIVAVSSITFSQLFAHARELLARSSVPARDVPLYINVFRLCLSLAWTFGPAIGAWILVLHSFKGAFTATALIFGVLLLVVLWQIPSAPPPAAADAAARVPLRVTLRRPDLRAYFVGFVLINACGTIGMVNLPLLVTATLRGTSHHVAVIYSLAPLAELPLLFYFGMKASRGDSTRIIRLGAIIAVIYYAGLLAVRAPWQIYPLQILSAAMTAVNSGVAITFFQDYLPGQAGTATNLYVSATRLGSTVGYLLFGTLASLLGYRAVFGVCAALSAATLLLFVLQRRRDLAHSAATLPAAAA